MAENINVRVILKDVRLSFCEALFTPKKFGDSEEGKPRYSSNFLISKSTDAGKKQIAAVRAAIKEAAAKKWKDKIPNLGPDKFFFRDGDNMETQYDGYADHWYVSAHADSKRRPRVVDGKKRDLREEDGKPYAGCYVNAVISVWCQDNKWGKRVNATLEAVQFLRDGEAFAARAVNVDEVFDEIEDGEGAFDEPVSSSGDASALL